MTCFGIELFFDTTFHSNLVSLLLASISFSRRLIVMLPIFLLVSNYAFFNVPIIFLPITISQKKINKQMSKKRKRKKRILKKWRKNKQRTLKKRKEKGKEKKKEEQKGKETKRKQEREENKEKIN